MRIPRKCEEFPMWAGFSLIVFAVWLMVTKA